MAFSVHDQALGLRTGLFEPPALLAVATSAAAGIATLELVRRARFEAARYLASIAVAAVVVGWPLAQAPELLPGLTVEEAAATRPVLVATVLGVAAGAIILVPSLALLFGLVLRGRFDRESAPEPSAQARGSSRAHRSLTGVAVLSLAGGLPGTLLPAGGVAQAIGVTALLAFVALGSIAIASSAARAA